MILRMILHTLILIKMILETFFGEPLVKCLFKKHYKYIYILKFFYTSNFSSKIFSKNTIKQILSIINILLNTKINKIIA